VFADSELDSAQTIVVESIDPIDLDDVEISEHIETAMVHEQTVNASTTVVETLEMTADDALGGGAASSNSQSSTSSAADEYRRSKRETRSIFRQKRP
jgi:hypothetical protein